VVVIVWEAKIHHPLEVLEQTEAAFLAGLKRVIATAPDQFHLDLDLLHVFSERHPVCFNSGHEILLAQLPKLVNTVYHLFMKLRNWPALIERLPEGLTTHQIARRFRVPYLTAWRAARRFGYPAVDGRRMGQRHRRKLKPELVDWRKSNVEIARELLVSRQLVSFVRHRQGVAVSVSTRRRNFHNGKRSNYINHTHKHTK
jgi:hypothetical protein